MATLQLYDKLLQFPLFQGMSISDLRQIVAHTKFDFLKLPANKRVIKDGERCDKIYFLTNGCLRQESVSDDHSYAVIEELPAPAMIQPECIVGLNRRFHGTFHTLTDVNFITIDKREVSILSDSFLVFRLNLLNIFATQTQKLQRRPWTRCPRNLHNRIVRFFIDHCNHPAGKKIFHIKMEQLALELNDSRINISRALNAMQDKGMVTLGRSRIEIAAIEHLMMGE
ncbi:MAG: Crp/Fnr family transcriptional regulator [Prevotella sp.]